MGLTLGGIVSSIRKSMQLRRLSKQLGSRSSAPPTMDDILGQSPARRKHLQAEGQLLSMIESDPNLHAVMLYRKVGRSELEKCLHRLLYSSCAVWARGHFVAVSALVFVPTLDYVLRFLLPKIDGAGEPYGPSDLEIDRRLVEYFERGEVGPVTPDGLSRDKPPPGWRTA